MVHTVGQHHTLVYAAGIHHRRMVHADEVVSGPKDECWGDLEGVDRPEAASQYHSISMAWYLGVAGVRTDGMNSDC